MDYKQFVRDKSQLDGRYGFSPYFLPDSMFDFQAHLTKWAIEKGRAAIFADCGLGKSLMELVWADNVYRHTGKPVIILTPLAVSKQFTSEGEKFGYEVSRSRNGEIESPIIAVNYERLHYFNPDDFGGVVCDESSILKNFKGTRKAQITEFMRMQKYRLLATATAAPNDYPELGTSSEALGYLGYMDMLGRFFTNNQNNSHGMNGRWRSKTDKFRFKGYAEESFWRWVSSWAKALRMPSDLGFSDDGFVLPPMTVVYHKIAPDSPPPGMLLTLPASGLQEQETERRRTIKERCEVAAKIDEGLSSPHVVWCHLNDEGDLLEKMMPNAVQVAGKHSDEQKEEMFDAFSSGQIKTLITKPKIGAWGLNWQHCSNVTYFPSHSYEQYYQAVRRCYRFGQDKSVTVNVVGTDGEMLIMENLQKKEVSAVAMFQSLIAHMNDALSIQRVNDYNNKMEVPQWLS